MSVKKLSVFFKPASMIDTLTMSLKSASDAETENNRTSAEKLRAHFVANNRTGDQADIQELPYEVSQHDTTTACNVNAGIVKNGSSGRLADTLARDRQGHAVVPPHPDILCILGAARGRKKQSTPHKVHPQDV